MAHVCRTGMAVVALGLLAPPALAEGGAFPSLGAMVFVGLTYLLLVPLVISGLVGGLLQVSKRQGRLPWGRIVGTALLIWGLGLVGLSAAPNVPGGENTLLGVAALLAFAGACTVGFRRSKPRTSPPLNPLK